MTAAPGQIRAAGKVGERSIESISVATVVDGDLHCPPSRSVLFAGPLVGSTATPLTIPQSVKSWIGAPPALVDPWPLPSFHRRSAAATSTPEVVRWQHVRLGPRFRSGRFAQSGGRATTCPSPTV